MPIETLLSGIILMSLVIFLIGITRPAIKCTNKVITGERFAKLLYTDERGGKLLHAKKYNLQGKPDYIFQKWLTGKLIPFEVKSGICREEVPHEGDLMQLVCYFLIIEEHYGKRPSYGRLVYSNKTFNVRNTAHLRRQLKRVLMEMQKMMDQNGICQQDADPSYIKCKNCVCQKTVCEWQE